MTELGARQSILRGWLRLLLVLGLVLGSLLLVYRRAPSDEAMSVLPWLCFVFVSFLAPVFLSRETGVFSPPGLVGINGGLATAAMVAQILRDGEVTFDVLGVMTEQQRIDLAVRSALLVLVAQLAYLAGYYGSRGTVAARFFPNVAGRRWNGGKLLWAIFITAVIVAPFYYLFQRRVGGSLFDVTALGRGKAVLQEDPTLTWMVRGILFAYVPILLLASMAVVDRSRSLLALTGIALLLVGVLVTRLGPRQPAFLGALMVLVLFNYLWRRINPSLVIGMLLVSVVIVNALGSYRTHGQDQEVDLRQDVANPMDSMARHGDDRSRLQVLGVLMHYFPQRKDYLLGESYVALSVSFIPRWIWPEKGEHFQPGNRIVQRLVGLPAPVPYYGELYANFSWLGVLVGMALFGAFHRGLARYRESSPDDLSVCLIYTIFVIFFTPTAMGISATAQYAVPIIGLIYLLSRRQRERVAKAEHMAASPA